MTKLSKQHNIPVKYTIDINNTENVNWIRSLDPDIIFCFGWSKLLKKETGAKTYAFDSNPKGIEGSTFEEAHDKEFIPDVKLKDKEVLFVIKEIKNVLKIKN